MTQELAAQWCLSCCSAHPHYIKLRLPAREGGLIGRSPASCTEISRCAGPECKARILFLSFSFVHAYSTNDVFHVNWECDRRSLGYHLTNNTSCNYLTLLLQSLHTLNPARDNIFGLQDSANGGCHKMWNPAPIHTGQHRRHCSDLQVGAMGMPFTCRGKL